MSRGRRRVSTVGLGVLVTALLGAGTALGDGTCGHDFDGPTACPITTSGTVTGSLATSSENDYYVFYAKKGTQLTLTVTDTEDPTCGDPLQPIYRECSLILVRLLDGRGNYLGQSDLSEPLNGIPVPETISRTLRAGGTYYALVTGVVFSTDPIPSYSLAVNGTPNVQWPPPCVVPKLRRDTSLGRAKSLLASHLCSVGRIRRVRSAQVRRGDVVGLRPRAGTLAPYGARVGILVSRGR